MGFIDIIRPLPLLFTALSSRAVDKPQRHRKFHRNKFFLVLGTPGIEPGAAGIGSLCANHCATRLPHDLISFIASDATRQAVGLDDVGDEEDGGEDEGDAPRGDVKRALTLLEAVVFELACKEQHHYSQTWTIRIRQPL